MLDIVNSQIAPANRDILTRYVVKAVENGCEELSIIFRDGYELVSIQQNGQSYGVDKLELLSPEGALLKDQLVSIVYRAQLFNLGNAMYFLKAKVVESSDGYVFHVVIKAR
jgi:hypothetical protein